MFCPVVVGVDLLEGDIQLDEVRSAANIYVDSNKSFFFSHCLVLFFHYNGIRNYKPDY